MRGIFLLKCKIGLPACQLPFLESPDAGLSTYGSEKGSDGSFLSLYRMCTLKTPAGVGWNLRIFIIPIQIITQKGAINFQKNNGYRQQLRFVSNYFCIMLS